MAKAYLDELLSFFASRFHEYLLVWNEEPSSTHFSLFSLSFIAFSPPQGNSKLNPKVKKLARSVN